MSNYNLRIIGTRLFFFFFLAIQVIKLEAGGCLPSNPIFDLNDFIHAETILEVNVLEYRIDYDTLILGNDSLFSNEEYYILEVTTVYKGIAAKKIKINPPFMKSLPKLKTGTTYIIYLGDSDHQTHYEFTLVYCGYRTIPFYKNYQQYKLFLDAFFPDRPIYKEKLMFRSSIKEFKVHKKILHQLLKENGKIRILNKKIFSYGNKIKNKQKFFLFGNKKNDKFVGTLYWLKYGTVKEGKQVKKTYQEVNGKLVFFDKEQ